MGPINSPETSVLNHLKLHNDLEDEVIQDSNSAYFFGSLFVCKSTAFLVSLNFYEVEVADNFEVKVF